MKKPIGRNYVKKKTAPIKVVSRQFLNDLADEVFDRDQKTFIRLCAGTLQNGPDPENPKRSMHCGLGELYFAMTGLQPKTRRTLSENDVVALAVKQSTLISDNKVKIANAVAMIRGLPKFIADYIEISSVTPEDDERVGEFSDLLDSIADVNDNVEGTKQPGWDDACEIETPTTYRRRAAAVATILRKAAKLLPA